MWHTYEKLQADPTVSTEGLEVDIIIYRPPPVEHKRVIPAKAGHMRLILLAGDKFPQQFSKGDLPQLVKADNVIAEAVASVRKGKPRLVWSPTAAL